MVFSIYGLMLGFGVVETWRRDSFITHRAFCDALAQESARAQVLPSTNTEENPEIETAVSSSPTALSPSTTVLSIQSPGNNINIT